MAKDKLNLILVILVLMTVIIGVTCYCSVGTYSNDEWWIIPFSHTKSYFQNILYSDQGLVWSYNYQRFLINNVSSLLHVHPQQNICIQLARALDYAVFIFILSLYYKPSDRKIPCWGIVLINTFLIFSIAGFVNINQIVQINQHFKYILNLILGLSIWFMWINEFLNDNLKKNILRDCIFVIILAFSGHLVNIPTIALFSLLFIYKAVKSEKFIQYLKGTLSSYYPVLIVYLACLVAYISLPGFSQILDTRVPDESIISYSLKNFLTFTKEFIYYIFSSQYISVLLVILLIGLILLILYRKKIDEKCIVLSFSILFANLSFQYALLTCGRTYYDMVSYWFISPEITSTFLFYIVLNCNIVYGSLLRLIDKNNFKIFVIIFLVIVINLIFPVNISYEIFKTTHEKQIVQRIAIYKLNKIFRYYSLNMRPILYPIEYHKKINEFGIVSFLTPTLITKNLMVIYNVESTKPSVILNEHVINEDELFGKDELDNIDFNKLYDDKFILKMKEPLFGAKVEE